MSLCEILILLLFNNLNGINTKRLSGRIIGGQKAYAGQFPWNAYLLIKSGKSYSICGGSLISQEWVLTASHCVWNAEFAKVQFGSLVRGGGNGKIRYSEKIYTHPEYSRNTRDIALIKLKKPIKFTNVIKAVSLPPHSMTIESLKGKKCLTSGFGIKSRKKAIFSNKLRFTIVRILPPQQCFKIYSSLQSTNSGLCGEETVKDQSVCRGDSGGGLVCKVGGKEYVVGVVSFGSAYCKVLPTAFQTTINNLDWITKVTGIKLQN